METLQNLGVTGMYVLGVINLVLAGVASLLFFAFKNYVKSNSETMKSLQDGQQALKDSIHDWKYQFAQNYAEKEDNKSSHKNMWSEIRRIDRSMVYLATKSPDVDIKDMQAIAGGDHG